MFDFISSCEFCAIFAVAHCSPWVDVVTEDKEAIWRLNNDLDFRNKLGCLSCFPIHPVALWPFFWHMLSDAANIEGKIFFSNNLFIPSLRRLFLGLAHSGQKNCILLTEELFVEKLSGARQILGHVSWFKPQGKYKFLLLSVQLGYNGYPFCRWGIWSVNTRMSSPRII